MNSIDKLVATYPDMFDTDAIAGSSLPVGWLELVTRLCADLQSGLQVGEYIAIEQIKPKFGALRFYARCPPRLRLLIHAAQEESMSICTECGKPAEQVVIDDIVNTLCIDYADKRRCRR
jgi:hypothetical protein